MADPFLILLVGVVIVVGGIIGLKLHPFLALILAAFVVSSITSPLQVESFALAKGMSAGDALALSNKSVGERLAQSFGSTCGKIGILIAMAAIIGKCLLESGAAEKIIRSILQLTGMEKAPIAYLVGSFFVGIPVFFDTVIFLMMPLVKAMAIRIGKNYLLLVLCIVAGAAMANSLVPPTPGPLFLVSEMQIPIGTMMIAGIIVGSFTITSGYFFALWANKKWPAKLSDTVDTKLDEIKVIANRDEKHLPSLAFSLMPVLIPLILICADTIMKTVVSAQEFGSQLTFYSSVTDLVTYLGNKNIAITIGAIAGLVLLAKEKKSDLKASVQNALLSGGGIILITAAGGAFGGMLQQTGISSRIAEITAGYQMALIPLAFLIAAVVRSAQGSATVALITTSGILSGLALNSDLAFHPVYLGLAIGCGSKIVPWMNDSGFWIICKLSNLTEKQALRALAPLFIVMGLTGLIVVMIGAKLFPLI